MAKFIIALVVCSFLAAASALPKHRKIHPARVEGGEEAKQGDCPYQISLRRDGSHYCGGSIVVVKGTHIVVTAALCVNRGESPDSLSVVAGDLRRSDNSGLEQIRRVTRIVIHEENHSYFNDIALLWIESPFDFNENVGPIALPTQEQQTSGEVVVSGWGANAYGNFTDILQYVQIPVVSDADCQTAHDWVIYPSTLCAGLVEGGKGSSCNGDFGGPLRAVDGNYLAGIVSYGYGCFYPEYPNLNTEVAYYVDWINNQVQ